MTKNFAANLKIGAALSSSVNRVFGGLKSKIKEQEATLKGLRSAYKEAAKGTGEYAGKLDELKAKIQAAEREMKRLRSSAKFDIGGGFKTVGGAFLGDAKRLAAGAGIATAAVVGLGAAVYSTTRGFVDWADDIGDSAEALGMSTQALQTWQFAAATVGVGGAKMTASIAKFSKSIMEGGKATDETLTQLGFNAARLRKLSLDQQLEAVAEAFKDYKGADKAGLAMKLFGKSGYQLAGILAKGKKGLDEFRKAGEETGAVLNDEAAAAAGNAASALDMFDITMVGLRNTIAIQFVPALTRMTERFTQLVRDNGPKIREWATGLAGVIETKVVPALGRFADKLPGIIDGLTNFLGKSWAIVTAVKDFVGGWDNLGIALLAINFAPTIAAVGSLATSLWTLSGASWAVVGPWGILLATFTAMMAVVGDGNPLEGLKFTIKALGREAQALWTIYKDLWSDFGQDIGRNIEALSVVIDETIASIKQTFTDLFAWLTAGFNAVIAKITGMWNKVKELGASIKGLLSFGGDDAPAVAPQIMKPENMAAPGGDKRTSNNTWNINVTAPGADGRRIADQIRTEFQRKPLFDSDSALVPA